LEYADIFKPFELNKVNPMLCDFSLREAVAHRCVMSRGYNLSEADRLELLRQVQDLERRGFVEEIPGTEHPQILSPAFLVDKADGTKRFVVDYGKLNDLIAPCALPLPVMDHLLNLLAKCPVKSKMDLQSGFWQVQLTDRAKALTAFVLPSGEVYRFVVLPMGLSISPGVFQLYTARHVRKFKQQPAVQKLLETGNVVEVMMDDFLFGSPSQADHILLLEEWFKYGRTNKLFFKESKCEFGSSTLIVLGRKVGIGEWGPVEERILEIVAERPQSKQDLRRILGCVNWVRRHVVDVEPTYILTDLLKKNRPWEWDDSFESAWMRLCESLKKATAVAPPQGDGPMILVTDASEYGGGGSLLQIQDLEDGQAHSPIFGPLGLEMDQRSGLLLCF
jgi:hypothetical protein